MFYKAFAMATPHDSSPNALGPLTSMFSAEASAATLLEELADIAEQRSVVEEQTAAATATAEAAAATATAEAAEADSSAMGKEGLPVQRDLDAALRKNPSLLTAMPCERE